MGETLELAHAKKASALAAVALRPVFLEGNLLQGLQILWLQRQASSHCQKRRLEASSRFGDLFDTLCAERVNWQISE